MLTPKSQEAKDRSTRILRISRSQPMQDHIASNLTNKGQSFKDCSRQGLESTAQDKTFGKNLWTTGETTIDRD